MVILEKNYLQCQWFSKLGKLIRWHLTISNKHPCELYQTYIYGILKSNKTVKIRLEHHARTSYNKFETYC